MQKDGIARIFDGFVIASGITLASGVTGHVGLNLADYVLLSATVIFGVILALLLRRE